VEDRLIKKTELSDGTLSHGDLVVLINLVLMYVEKLRIVHIPKKMQYLEKVVEKQIKVT
jgi:hypothetical protein